MFYISAQDLDDLITSADYLVLADARFRHYSTLYRQHRSTNLKEFIREQRWKEGLNFY